MATINYRPLAPGEIRILKPLPGTRLSFQLGHTDISKGKAYTALSYTWGSPSFTHSIVVDEQPVSVTANLFQALQAIQELPSSTSALWIDAICINQADTNERSVQVQLMKSLYESTEAIYIWLGPAEDNANALLAAAKMKDFDNRITQNMKQNRGYRPWWWPNKKQPPADASTFLLRSSTTDKSIFDGPGSQTYRAWLGISAAWRSTWWTRTWIYQEATVPENIVATFVRGIKVSRASSKISFLNGPAVFTWSQLRAALMLATHLVSMKVPGTAILREVRLPMVNVWNLRAYRSRGDQMELLELLQMFRHTGCSDLRDKVYAPLCLAPRSAVIALVPNYGKSVQEVCTDVVLYQLQQKSHELDFLGYTMDTSQAQAQRLFESAIPQPSSWPTWLPDWSRITSISPIPKSLHLPSDTSGREIRPYATINFNAPRLISKVYNATGNLDCPAFIDNSTLHIQAIYCDTITDLIRPHNLGAVATTITQATSQFSTNHSDNYHMTNEPIHQVITRSLALDVKYNPQGSVYARGGSIDVTLLATRPHQMTPADLETQTGQQIAFERATTGRCLCRTSSGMIGLVPQSAIRGDTIWATVGGQVLYVLKAVAGGGSVGGNRVSSREERYTFVGEAYIHGLMDGRAVEWVREGRAEIRHLQII